MEPIAGLLQNPLVLTLLGLAVKYFPPLAKLPNLLIPFLNTALALLGALAAGTTHPAAFAVAAFGGTFFGTLASACWTAIQSALIYEVFGRHPLEKGLGWHKAK